ncbi:MAG: cyclic nucleotide-binding domain-containing protein [Ignavibacteriaceae bacterium]
MSENEKIIIKNSFWANIFKSKTESDEILEILKQMPPFENLRPKELKDVLALIHNRTYSAGETIFLKGDPGISLYIIVAGTVAILDEGKSLKLKLAEFSRGDFFGEIALIDNENRSASAVAETKCTLAAIFKPDLDEFMLKNPKAGVSILKGLAKIITARLRNLNTEYFILFQKLSMKGD